MQRTEQKTMPNLLTLDQTAQTLGIGRTKLGELVNREGLPVIRFGHKAVRVDPVDLQKWLERRVQKGA